MTIKNGLTIRAVSASDKSRWLALMQAYAKFYKVEVDDAAMAAT